MMASDFIIDVTEEDFEYEVVSYSQNTPVVVDFWAEWCRPCKILSPILEQLANEARGGFRLAKVDADANPNLALRYNVHTLPTIKVFSGGEVVGEFVGLQPIERLREFLSRMTPPSPLALAVEKGESLLGIHEWQEAEETFREILDEAPENPAGLLGLSKALIGQGEVREALYTLEDFPASLHYRKAELLLPLCEELVRLDDDELPGESDLDAAYRNSLRLARRGRFVLALDGLLEVLRQDKRYRDGKARRVFVGILELLGEEDPDTREYRAELASVLF